MLSRFLTFPERDIHNPHPSASASRDCGEIRQCQIPYHLMTTIDLSDHSPSLRLWSVSELISNVGQSDLYEGTEDVVMDGSCPIQQPHHSGRDLRLHGRRSR